MYERKHKKKREKKTKPTKTKCTKQQKKNQHNTADTYTRKLITAERSNFLNLPAKAAGLDAQAKRIESKITPIASLS